MSNGSRDWLKGNLPGWIGAAFLALLTFIGSKLWENSETSSVRLTILEERVQQATSERADIKSSHLRILSELKELNKSVNIISTKVK